MCSVELSSPAAARWFPLTIPMCDPWAGRNERVVGYGPLMLLGKGISTFKADAGQPGKGVLEARGPRTSFYAHILSLIT